MHFLYNFIHFLLFFFFLSKFNVPVTVVQQNCDILGWKSEFCSDIVTVFIFSVSLKRSSITTCLRADYERCLLLKKNISVALIKKEVLFDSHFTEIYLFIFYSNLMHLSENVLGSAAARAHINPDD